MTERIKNPLTNDEIDEIATRVVLMYGEGEAPDHTRRIDYLSRTVFRLLNEIRHSRGVSAQKRLTCL